ncbi:MAG: hypothetical protein IT514_13740 [Burkholderiales bacterium]|nr:hypothetical protein [Burkholderiales bacterium]
MGIMVRWASTPLGTSASVFLTAVRSGTPVSLIATPRADLKVRQKARWRGTERDPELADFDQVPLTSRDGVSIEAVFVRGTGLVALHEGMFMASDAPLISFLESADQQRFRFLLDDRSISGLVTLSDIQELPVYSVLFGLVIPVEMLLVDWIRKTCGSKQNAWLDLLEKKQRGIVERYWKDANKRNLAIDRLSCASFGQEIQAAQGLGLFEGTETHYAQLKALETLRHQICHAAEIALTPEQALTIPNQVRNAHAMASWLQAEIQDLSA